MTKLNENIINNNNFVNKMIKFGKYNKYIEIKE